jgi:hypothetical protein
LIAVVLLVFLDLVFTTIHLFYTCLIHDLSRIALILQSFDDKALQVVKGVLELLKYSAGKITISCSVVSKIQRIQNNNVCIVEVH